MIELTDLSVSFGPVRAVDAVTATFDAPITGVIGPNGAGKTTMLSAMAGTVNSTGSIKIDGIDLTVMSAYQRARAGVRRTFQTDQVVLQLNVVDNVLVGADAASKADRSGIRDQAMNLLEFVGMQSAANRPGRSLTNNERRKVEIARSLMGETRVLLMDEPGAGLLADEKAELEKLIEAIPKNTGARVVLIEHDIDLVSRVCSHSIVLDFGQLIAEGDPGTVLTSKRVRAAYLGETDDEESK